MPENRRNLVFEVKGDQVDACRIAGIDGKLKGAKFSSSVLRAFFNACKNDEDIVGLTKKKLGYLESVGIIETGRLVLNRIEVRENGRVMVGNEAVNRIKSCIIISNPSYGPQDSQAARWADQFIEKLVGSDSLVLDSIIKVLFDSLSNESRSLLLEVVRYLRKKGRINLARQILNEVEVNIKDARFRQRILVEHIWLSYFGASSGARKMLNELKGLDDANSRSSNLIAYADIHNLIALFTERLDGSKRAQEAFNHALFAAIRSGDKGRILGAMVNRQVSLCNLADADPNTQLLRLIDLMRLSDADKFPRDFYLARQIFLHLNRRGLSLSEITHHEFFGNILAAVKRHQMRTRQPDIRRAELLAAIGKNSLMLHGLSEWGLFCECVRIEKDIDGWSTPGGRFRRANIADSGRHSAVLQTICVAEAD